MVAGRVHDSGGSNTATGSNGSLGPGNLPLGVHSDVLLQRTAGSAPTPLVVFVHKGLGFK